MGIAAKEQTADASFARDLTFRFLPAYARHLLDHQLDALVRHQVALARELRLPMLRFLVTLNDQQLFHLTEEALREMLNDLVENNAAIYIRQSLERWQADAAPVITRDQIGIDDIAFVWHIRRCGMMAFLDSFTTNPADWKNIAAEIDSFSSESEALAFKLYVSDQHDLYVQAQRLTGIGNFVWDIAKNTFAWSEELYRLYEWEPGTPVDYERVLRVTHPDDLTKAQTYLRHLWQTHEPYDYHYRIVTASGREKILHARGTLRFDNAGKAVRMIGALQDVTEKIQKEEALQRSTEKLRASEEQFRLLVSNVKDYAIFMLSPQGIIETWNAGAQHIKQYAADEIIGKHFSTFYTEEDKARNHPQHELEIAVREGRYEEEGWRVKKDGSRFWANVVITAVYDEKETLRGFAKVTRDMTQRMLASRQLEETVQELERSNSELQSFSYAASHDLQEPLRKIQTFASRILAKDAGNLAEGSRDLFSRLMNAAARMQRLIDDLLIYSRVGTQAQLITDVDLNTVLDDIRNTHKTVYGEKQVTISAAKLPQVRGSVVQLTQMFENLISNSIKYAKPDVPPVIEIEAEPMTMPPFGPRRHTHFYKITLLDNGIGFEPEYNERIFEMFQRLHGKFEYEGTGIGLSIVRKIAQNHGGFIEADGKPGVGAIFSLYLPSEQV